MLHTPYSLYRLLETSEIVLNHHNYTAYDSRYFNSTKNMDDSFTDISSDCIRIWLNTIKPFLDAIIKNEEIYRVERFRKKPIVYIPEEGIYFNLLGLSSSDVKYFYSTGSVRLIGIGADTNTSTNNHLSIFNSPVYDPIHKTHYTATTIIFFQRAFMECKEDKDLLNRILLRLVHLIAVAMLDNALMCDYKVPVNRIFAADAIDSNKDVILMPEVLNLSDTRFILNYFYTLFYIEAAAVDISAVGGFVGYSRVIALPDIFKLDLTDEEAEEAETKINTLTDEEATEYVNGFKYKIFKRIWDIAIRGEIISDKDYVDICGDIMLKTEINLDTDFYDALEQEQQGYTTEDQTDPN